MKKAITVSILIVSTAINVVHASNPEKQTDPNNTNLTNENKIDPNIYNSEEVITKKLEEISKLPDNFDATTYGDLNPDITQYYNKSYTGNMSKKEFLEWHYRTTGRNEERVYKEDLPDGFNAITYGKLNQDLIDYWLENYIDLDFKSDEEFFKWHYKTTGKNENRPYKES